MLGVCFALNLAYVGLERFRYREKIKSYAKKRLDDLKNHEKLSKSSWLKTVTHLAKLPNDSKALNKTEFPRESWCKWYRCIFNPCWDFNTSIFLTFCSAILIAIGVSHQSGVDGILGWMFAQKYYHCWWWAITLSSIVPVWFVWIGKEMVFDARHYIDQQVDNMESALQDEARSAKVEIKQEDEAK